MNFLRKFLKPLVRPRYYIMTFLLVGFMFLISNTIAKLEVFNPLELALADMSLTDIVFSKLRDEQHLLSEENEYSFDQIVLVNIGELPRAGIALQLKNIARHNPKVVGIDAFFRKEKDPIGDSLLADAMSRIENLVLVSELDTGSITEKGFENVNTSHSMYSKHAETGYANLITEGPGKLKVNRSFDPVEKIGEDKHLAFPVKIASYHSPEKVQKFIDRNREIEYINFRAHKELFTRLDAEQAMDPENENLKVVENKIVLLGYLGSSIDEGTWEEDKFYTPLNPNYAGKATPDMFGLVIHANIINMILNEDYINSLSGFWNIVLNLIILFINVIFLNKLYFKKSLAYDGISKLTQFTEVFVLMYLVIIVFDQFSQRVDLSLAIFGILLAGDFVDIYNSLSFTSSLKKLLTKNSGK